MTINYLANTASSVLGSVTSGGAQTQLALTASAPFEVNDLVFVDWKTGAILNQNSVPPKAALAPGPAMQSYIFDDFPSASSNSTGGISQIGPDGSLYLLASAYNGAGPYRRAIVLYKYNSKGVLQSKGIVLNTSSSSSATLINTCSFALLSNGNILVTYIGVQASTVYSFVVLNSSLRMIYSGNVAGAAGSPAAGVYHIQPTSNGGAILATTSGIEYISALGVASRPVTHIGVALAWHDHLKDANAAFDVYARPVPVKSGTAGAFGYMYSSTASSYAGCFYAVIEADGTLRGSVVSLTTNSVNQMHIAVSSANNNILWVNHASGYYGVVTDAGVKVKDATGITNYGTTAVGIRVSSDGGGNFLLMTLNTTDFKWYLRYMTPAGADVAAALVIGSLNGNQPGFQPYLAKLSSGTVYVLPGAVASSLVYYAFVSNSGALLAQGLLVDFGYPTGSSGLNMSITVFNDTVYGVGTIGATTLPTDMAVFSISNTGAVVLSGDAMNGISGRGVFDTGQPLRAFVDETGKYLQVVGTTYSSSYTVILTYDINLNLLAYTQLQVVTGAQFQASYVRVFGQGLLATGSLGATDGTSPGLVALYVKPKTTILLGVAANAAAEGGTVVVNTKGVFPVSAPWKGVSQAFDSSTSIPAGNAGSIGGGFINLKGL